MSYYLVVVFVKDFCIYVNDVHLYSFLIIPLSDYKTGQSMQRKSKDSPFTYKISRHDSGGSKALDLLQKDFFFFNASNMLRKLKRTTEKELKKIPTTMSQQRENNNEETNFKKNSRRNSGSEKC